MNGKTLLRAVRVLLVLALATATSMLAQDPRPEHFSGVINDFTPITGGTTAYEVHGPWSLSLDHDTGKAHFSASLTMELSVLGQSAADVQTGNLAQHTHNITMDGTVIYDPTDCPPAASTTPPYVARIEINGTASVFANGSTAPFGQFSQLQVCIAGGMDTPQVPFSNVTLVFQNPAAKHFGPQAIHGLVRKAERLREEDQR
ncbi:MAG: hypothetical protein WAK48_02440 [Candidatus Acidiferrum sp.]|jgi:hypothetical protein